MQYEEIRCRVCGSEQLEKQGDGTYVCKHCRAHFRENDLKEYKEAIRGELREVVTEALVMQRAQDIANIRRNLFEAIQEEYTDSYKIVGYCRDLKKLMPNDFQANCFEVLNNGRKKEINAMLAGVDSKGEGRFYIKDMLDFMAKSLTPANLLLLKGLIDRTMDGTEKTEYLNKIEEEAGKYEAGLYSPNVPRKAFIAYSSKDMAIVIPLVGYLESVGISCFVALRNMRHGRGAVENYEGILQRAMHNCKSFVFVSTRNSRRFDCDAMEKEIPYIQDYEPKVKRIEYLVDDYGENEGAAKALLKEFFGGSEWVRNPEDLPLRITGLESSKPVAQAAVKYCLFCGEENIMTAISCKRCEKREFGTKEEYEARQEELKCQEAERREAERKEAERIAAERRKVERRETEKKAEVSVESKPTAEGESVAKINPADFEIQKGVLIRYKGKGGAVVIPNSVTSIGDWAFYGCSGLTSIIIASSVRSIGYSAFQDCSSLTSIIIPSSVRSIDGNAFLHCSSLTSITIPNSVTSIGADAFSGCESLEGITVKEENPVYHSAGNCLIETAIGTLVAGCKNSEIPTDGSVESIGDSAFCGCSNLTSIIIPNSVTSIGESAFQDCSSLANITIPDSVTSIGANAFWSCESMEGITVKEGNPVYHSAGNCLIETESGTLVVGCKNSKIPTDGSVTSIGDDAFWDCSGLTSITIPNSVTSIGGGAFSGCNRLTNITIPNSVTSIGDWAFYGCSGLTSITIPDSVESIGDSAFQHCSSLTSITIPNSVTSIGADAFSGCESLEGITVKEGNPVYHSAGNCLIETASGTLVAGCKNSEIPTDGSVESIGDSAFYGCSNLTSITIPNSVTSSIGDSAFSGCSSLTSIIIPSSVRSIGENAFQDCSSLTSITIPNSVASIRDWAFYGCRGLTSITIPKNVMSIKKGVFVGCSDDLKIYCHRQEPSVWPEGWDESLKGKIIWDE